MQSKKLPLLATFAVLLGALFWVLGRVSEDAVEASGVVLSEQASSLERGPTELSAERDGATSATMELGREVVDGAAAGVRVPGQGRLTGRVLDRATGAGAGEVRVSLYGFPPQGADMIERALRLGKTGSAFAARARALAVARTDAAGHFAFEGVRAGTYFAEARGELFVPDPVERVTLAPGGGEATLFVRAGGRVTGTVRGPDGAPAAGARVHVGQGEGVFIPSLKSGDILLRSTTTDARGRFEVGGLPPGPGFQVSATDERLGAAFLGGVEVEAGRSTKVELAFDVAARISGRVVSVSRSEEDGAEQRSPLEGASVAAVPRGLRELQFADELMAASAGTSNERGEFQLGALPPGEVDLIAWAPGHIPARVGPLPANPGGSFFAGELELRTGPVVHGRVVDEEGAPIEGVHVRWEMVDFQRGLELTFAPLLYQAVEGFEFPTTDAEGRFVAGPFPGQPKFRMDLFKTGYAQATARWDGDSTDELKVVMQRGSAVEGIVVDAVQKRPVTHFTISGRDRIDTADGAPGAENPFGGGQLVEDPAGRFRVPAVKPGTRRLVFSAPGYQSRAVEDLEVKAGEDLKGVIVQLDPGATLRGTVVDEAGQPVPGVRLAATRGGGFAGLRKARKGKKRGRDFAPDEIAASLPMGALAFGVGLGLVPSVLSDRDGKFELTGLGPGDWTVAGTHRDFATGSSEELTVSFDKGAEAPVIEGVVVTMEAGATLYGSVRDRRGTKQPGVMVIAFSPAEFASGDTAGGVYQAESDKDGDYRISNMVAGGYFLMVTRGDEHLDPFSFLGTMQFDLVTVPKTGELRRDLVDQTAASTRVHGLVLEAGAPVSGGAVMALSLEAENMLGVDVKMASVGHDGAYEFPGLPEGLYQFRYQGKGDSVGREVEVPDLAEARIDLELPDGVIHAAVLDAESGEPVPRSEVVVKRLDAPAGLGGLLGSMLGSELGKQSDYTDDDGDARLAGLESGRYEVQALGPRWGPRKGDFGPGEPVVVEVAEGGTVLRTELRLPRTHRIFGEVTDPGGLPIAGAWIVATAADGLGRAQKAKSREDGSFEVLGVGEGLYRLSVHSEEYADGELDGVDVAGAGAEVHVVLYEGVEVRVRITDLNGQPLPGAVARLSRGEEKPAAGKPGQALEGWFVGRGVADLEGDVGLGRFAPGTYRLEASRGSLAGVLEGVEVPQTGQLDLELSLARETP